MDPQIQLQLHNIQYVRSYEHSLQYVQHTNMQ